MKTSLIASGDSFVTRRIPAYPGRAQLQQLIASHDVCFNNLETTFHWEEGYPSAFSGGTWAMADPVILDDIQSMGFNLYNTANNHAMDYCHGGLLATIDNLKHRNMVFAGTGANLAEAARAAYLETKGLRIALIAATTDFHDTDLAGAQGPVMQGRPGVNGVRVNRTYHVTAPYFEMLRQLVAETKMNAYAEYGVKLGYVTPGPQDVLSVGGMKYKLSDTVRIEEQPHSMDLQRVIEEIQEARRQADYILVSIHTHAGSYHDYTKPPEFLESFAHQCIEAGADAILGHGPHELRAIELYHGKPIFYSLGNFIFETETVEKQPAEAFLSKGFPAGTKVGAYMDDRSNHGTRGYGTLPPIWFSVLPSWTVEDGQVREILLYPITLGMDLPRSRKGLPSLTQDPIALEHLRTLCQPYGTQIDLEAGIGVIRI